MTITEVIIVVLGSNAIWTFIQYLIDRHDKQKETPERIMLRALGEDRLGVLLRDWLHSDVRTATDWKIIDALYKGYDALGGNGEIKILYKEASEIHTTE